ncbi:DUF3631 domain-containing protein [Ruegeria sp. HKCCA4707]|uniref:DUF3631 domain-containing protein n=1 Tax=Ruegeria sp. HKCCA4707 TaxID=2682984 RepID=UPI0014876E0B|nr:DUF3631 domain-containing protein [Ruegeria sp. HKCCA4707]
MTMQPDQHPEPELCRGHGINDKPGTSFNSITVSGIRKLAASPQRVPKDKADWVIPSTYRGADARSAMPQLDKGEFYMLVVDVDDGNPSLGEVRDAVVEVLGVCQTIIYSTASATKELRKWRVMIPLQTSIGGGEYELFQQALVELLDVTGIDMDISGTRVAQLSYLPNRGPDFYEHQCTDDPVLFVDPKHPLRKRAAAIRKAAQVANEAAKAQQKGGVSNQIQRYNDDHPLEAEFERFGYKKQRGKLWRSPNETQGGGTSIPFPGRWVSFSGKDADAGIGFGTKTGHRSGDAFDLLVHYEYGGDREAAFKAIAKDYPPLSKHPERDAIVTEVAKDHDPKGLSSLGDAVAEIEARFKAASIRKHKKPEIEALVKAVWEREFAQEEAKGLPDAVLEWPKLEPKGVEVVLPELLDALVDRFRGYLSLDDRILDLLALWVVGAGNANLFSQYPRVLIKSPEPNSGKTTVLELMAFTVPQAVILDRSTSASVIAMFDIAKGSVAFFLDELDTWVATKEGNDDMTGIWNSGFERGKQSAKMEQIGNTWQPVFRSLYAPVAGASLHDLPPANESRAYVVRMVPDRTGSKQNIRKEKNVLGGNPLDDLRQQVVDFWAGEPEIELAPSTEDLDGLGGRDADRAVPLILLARFAGGDWYDRLRAGMAYIQNRNDPKQGPNRELLEDLCRVYVAGDPGHLPSSDAVSRLVDMSDRPWGDRNAGMGITQAELADLLRPYDLRPKNVWVDGKSPKGYKQEELEHVFEVYLGPNWPSAYLDVPAEDPYPDRPEF